VEWLNHNTQSFTVVGTCLLCFADNVEINNRNLRRAFVEQQPAMLALVPVWNNSRGFTFREAIAVTLAE
jgi:hypothetical protein